MPRKAWVWALGGVSPLRASFCLSYSSLSAEARLGYVNRMSH